MYCLNPEDQEPVFCLFDPIGFDESMWMAPYVNGSDFAKELLWMDGQRKKRIVLYINCEGGQVKDGYSIASVMLNMKTPVDVRILHTAASMGAIIAVCGRNIEMMDFGQLMLHLAYNSDGSEDKGLEATNAGIVLNISKRWGKSEEEVRKILEKETYFTAAEAKKAGLIDEIISCDDKNIPQAKADAKEKKAFAMALVRKTLSKEKIDTMYTKAEICELLNLDSNVSDAYARQAFDAHMAKAKKAMAKSKPEGEEDEADKKMKALEKENKELKAKAEADETAKALAEADDKKAKALSHAKTTITAKIKERGLTLAETAIDKYVAFAGVTEEGLKSVIEAIEEIPVIKKAPQMPIAKQGKPGEAPAYMEDELPLLPQNEAAPADKPSPNGFIPGDTSDFVKAFNKMPREQMAKVKAY